MNEKLKVLDLFSGIGGFSLGLERTGGFETIAFCEIDPFCRAVLAKHWPDVPCYEDVRKLWNGSTSSAAGSPVRTYPLPDAAPDLPASIRDSTGNWCEPFAWYDRATASWRTWQRCLVTEWEPFSGTWPRAGLTLNGIAYRRSPSAPLTSATGFGLLPTPIANDATKRGDFDIDRSKCLPGELRRGPLPMLPTPHANRWGLEDSHGSTEAWDQVLPTPRASDADKGGRSDLLTVLRGYETKHAGTLPTPMARDWRSGKASAETHGKNARPLNETVAKMAGNRSGRMNPRFREWMMGFPIGWTELERPEIPSSPKSPNSSAKRSSKRKRRT